MAYRRSRPTANTTVVVGDKRAARRTRRSRRGGFGGKMSLRLTNEWLIGCAAAFCLPQHQVIDAVAMVGATAPVRGLGQVRGYAMGYTCGQALQHIVLPQFGVRIPDFLGNVFAGTSSSNSKAI